MLTDFKSHFAGYLLLVCVSIVSGGSYRGIFVMLILFSVKREFFVTRDLKILRDL